MGTPAEGYQLLSYSCEPKTVRVKGTAAVLNTLDEVEIPAEVLDITGATSSIEKTIDISTYLEQGVSLVISSDGKINLFAEIEPIETKEYRVSISNLTASGLKSGYQLSYVVDYVLVDITAGKAAHNALNASDIKGVIKVDNMGEGTHVVEVLFDLNDEVYEAAPALVEVEIEAVKTNEDDSESTESTENSDGTTEEDSTQTGTDNSGTINNSESTESTESTENTANVDNNEVEDTEVTETETQTTSETTGE